MLQQIKRNIILLQKVELLKMASKMAVISASRTDMADILDKNTLILTFMDVKRLNDTNNQSRTWFCLIQKVEL